MNDQYKLAEIRTLEGKVYKPETIRRWENTESYPYFIIHISYRALFFADPLKHAKLLKENTIDPTKFPLERFPLIEDFHVQLRTPVWEHQINYDESQRKYNLIFFSPSRGYLASTDHTLPDLCQEDFVLPWGDFTIPYADLEQAWAILIAEKDQFVYVLQGEFEKVNEEGYHTWFKVEKNRYREEWDKALRLARTKCREWFTQQRACPPECCE